MTCRAAYFNDTGFVSSAVHQVDTWLPADFSAGTYQILTVTQHGCTARHKEPQNSVGCIVGTIGDGCIAVGV